MPKNAHDALFHLTFSSVEHASGALRAILPESLAAAIDFSTLSLEPGSFVDPKLDGRRADLLFSVNIRGTRSLLFFLFEHQSSSDGLMLLRLLEYMTRIWRAFLEAHPQARRLPPIVPVVLHHSKRGWHAPVCFDQLLDLDAETLELVGSLVPRFRIVLDDLSGVDDAALLARPMTSLGRVVFFLFRHAWDRERLLAELRRVAGLLADVARGRGGWAALQPILIYLRRVTRQEEAQIVMALQQALDESDYDAVMKATERYEAKVLEKGLEQGLEKGLLRLRNMLLRQLGLRFGELPRWAQDHVNAADADALDSIAERVVVASTLAEALGNLGENAPGEGGR